MRIPPVATQMTTPAAVTAGRPFRKLAFHYDWTGRRLARTITDTNNAVLSATRWLYDAWNPIAEYSLHTSSLILHTSYLWGLDISGTLQGAGGVGGLLSCVSQSSVSYPSFDGNGNITAWTQSGTTTPVCRREYDAFGNIVVEQGTAPCSIGFSTKIEDLETGLLYYGHRYLSPPLGRWIGQDPIEEEGGLSLYGFVLNDGVNWWDLLGCEEQSIKKIVLRRDVGKPVIAGNSLVIVNGHDPVTTKLAQKTGLTIEDIVKRAFGAGADIVVCASPEEIVQRLQEQRIPDHSRNVILVDHGAPRIETRGAINPAYPQIVRPVVPNDKNAVAAMKFLVKISETLVICNCHCGRAETDNIKGEPLKWVGLWGDIGSWCDQGVESIFVASRVVKLTANWDKYKDSVDKNSVVVKLTADNDSQWREVRKMTKEEYEKSKNQGENPAPIHGTPVLK